MWSERKKNPGIPTCVIIHAANLVPHLLTAHRISFHHFIDSAIIPIVLAFPAMYGFSDNLVFLSIQPSGRSSFLVILSKSKEIKAHRKIHRTLPMVNVTAYQCCCTGRNRKLVFCPRVQHSKRSCFYGKTRLRALTN
jgi:hypothetical protein